MGNESQQEADNLAVLEDLTTDYLETLSPLGIEGNYSSWVKDNLVLIDVGTLAPSVFFTGNGLAYSVSTHTTVYNILTHALGTPFSALPYPNWLTSVPKSSVLGTYILDVEQKAVMKNGVTIQTFTLPTGYVLLYGLTISPTGKYICVVLYNGSHYFLTLFVGTK